jgi:uncharacterized protein (DUF736 family)
MANIGTFHKQDDGALTGAIKTLTLNVKAAVFRPADKDSDKAPDFRIFAVKLDDPSFPAPIYASLVDAEDGYSLIWSRSRNAD